MLQALSTFGRILSIAGILATAGAAIFAATAAFKIADATREAQDRRAAVSLLESFAGSQIDHWQLTAEPDDWPYNAEYRAYATLGLFAAQQLNRHGGREWVPVVDAIICAHQGLAGWLATQPKIYAEFDPDFAEHITERIESEEWQEEFCEPLKAGPALPALAPTTQWVHSAK